MFGYAALLIAWLVLQPIPPLQDYEDWVYQGWVGAQMLSGQPAVIAHYAPVHHPVPNAASQMALTLLTAVAGPFVAAKLFIATLLAAFAAVCSTGCRKLRVGNHGALALVLFLVFAADSAFWDGYVNYQLSLLVLFCYLLLRDRLSPLSVGAFGILLFACHASTFFAFVLLVFIEGVLDRKRLPRFFALAPALALLVWYVLRKGDAVADQGPPGALYTGLLHHLEYKFYTLTKTGPFHNLVDFRNASLRDRSRLLYLFGVGINLVFGTVFSFGVLLPAWRFGRRQLRDPLLLTAIALFLIFLVLPGKTLGVINLGERLLYPGLLMAVLGMRRLDFSRTLAALGVCGIALTSAQFLTMPRVTAASPDSSFESTMPANEQYYDRYGLYNNRLYAFDLYRIFLQKPDMHRLPPVGFDTSLFLDRHP